MDKLGFNALSLQEQVQYINDQLSSKGLSVTKVCEDIGIDRSTVRKRFTKGGYTFNKDLNLYEGDILNGEEVKEIAPTSVKKPQKVRTFADDMIALGDRVRALEKQMRALENKVDNQEINTGNTTNANATELELLDFNADTVTRAYRLYEDVQKEFKIFCKKHSEYKVQDIISTALVEFMNKRK